MSINKVILKGRLGQAPETTTNGAVKFSLATSEKYQETEKTQWHNIVAFGKQGEVLQKYVSKGDEIVIIGKLDYYRTDDGKIYTSVIVTEFDFIKN